MTAFTPKNAAPRDVRELYHWAHKQLRGAGDAAEAKTATASDGVPASAAATGVAGTIAYDSDYIYVCVATDTWKRVGISTW
jgi:hypothetical protein